MNPKTVFLCVISALYCGVTGHVNADVVDEALLLMEAQNYGDARDLLVGELEENPNSRQLGKIYGLLGECEFYEGNNAQAEIYLNQGKQKGYVDANYFLGRLAMSAYDFANARKYYNTFNAAKAKSARVAALLPSAQKCLDMASKALQNVERIEVIDTVHVDADDFFKVIALSKGAGSLKEGAEAPDASGRQYASMVYVNEGKDFKMWAQPNDSTVNIAESVLLTDGSWQSPMFLPDKMMPGANLDYPFMTPDGTTLYFAADGPESMGGYDIFVASRDAATGEYMLPQNIGMPFNSPSNDYMMAIDEESGLGWWVSDREHLPGMVTVYVYVLSDAREKFPQGAEADEILQRASLYNPDVTLLPLKCEIAASEESDEDKEEFDAAQQRARENRADLLETLHYLRENPIDDRIPEFTLPMAAGVTYYFFDDFKSSGAADKMRLYLQELQKYEEDESRLDDMRRNYYGHPSQSSARQIGLLEKEVDRRRQAVKAILAEVYRLEGVALAR